VLRDRRLTTIDQAAYLGRARALSERLMTRIGATLAPRWPVQ